MVRADVLVASSRTRTCNRLLKRELLYQLSYGRRNSINQLKAKLFAFNPLSYGCKKFIIPRKAVKALFVHFTTGGFPVGVL